ncbi:MAG TPA: type II toxin-antitoxin system HicB family antitoxin [Stellaceae bacterium]|nr:type II toxin-antitoxin system HicB family antitoxin [Stellaceae bacterium]
MRRLAYPVTLTPANLAEGGDPADTGFVVTFRDLPEAITQGETVMDALDAAADGLEEALAHRLSKGIAIPVPSDTSSGERVIAPSITIAAKAALAQCMAEAGMTKVALAKLLDIDEKAVRRLLDPNSASKLPRIEEALAALGHRLVAELETA